MGGWHREREGGVASPTQSVENSEFFFSPFKIISPFSAAVPAARRLQIRVVSPSLSFHPPLAF